MLFVVNHSSCYCETMRLKLGILAIWGLVAVMCFLILKIWTIGPVVLIISRDWGMGVHLGDTLVLLPLLAGVWLTRRLWRRQDES